MKNEPLHMHISLGSMTTREQDIEKKMMVMTMQLVLTIVSCMILFSAIICGIVSFGVKLILDNVHAVCHLEGPQSIECRGYKASWVVPAAIALWAAFAIATVMVPILAELIAAIFRRRAAISRQVD